MEDKAKVTGVNMRVRMCICVCLCSVCLHVCTAQQTSKPSAHLLLMNKANSRSQGCLQTWSLFIGKHTHTQTHTHTHISALFNLIIFD